MDDVENQHPDGGIEDHDPDGVAAAEPDVESTCDLLLFTTVTFLVISGIAVYATTTLHGTRKALMAGLAAGYVLVFAICLSAGTVVTCIAGNTDGDQQEEEVELQHIEAPLE